MRVLIGMLMLGLFAIPASGEILIGNNPNVSDGGLNIAPPGAWTKVGGGSSARLDNDHNGIDPDDGGDWAVGGSDGSGSSAAYDNYYFQSFAPAFGPGQYDISLSGWSKAWAQWWSGENWNWVQEAHIELWVDNALVFDGMSSNNTNRDTWALHSYSGTHTVNSSIEVRLHSVKGNDNYGQGGLGAIFWDSRYDDITLDVVPEPAAALLLLAGLPLLRRRRA